ncbi:MAG: cell division protein FtsA [Bacteroidales bacterium]
MSKYVTAIDLGTTKIVAAVGEKSAGGIKILAYSRVKSTGIIKGEVVNIKKVCDALKPALSDLQNKIEGYRIDKEKIYVGITAQNLRCISDSCCNQRSNPTDYITEEELNTYIEKMYNTKVEANEKVIYCSPQFYNIDEYQGVKDAVGMTGNTIEAYYQLFIGKKTPSLQAEQTIIRSGLKLETIVLNPIATSLSVLDDEDKELGCVMVDIGSGTTDMVIYHDKVIRYAAVIPFAGNSITEDIRQECELAQKTAEAIKQKQGTAIVSADNNDKNITIKSEDGITKKIPFNKLTETIEARASEICATIKHEIEKSGYQGKLRRGIILTGGSSSLTHLQILLKEITGLNVFIKTPSTSKEIMNTSVPEITKRNSSTICGLIQYGFMNMEKRGIEIEENNPTLFGTEVEKTEEEKEKESNYKKSKKKKKKERSIGGFLDDFFSSKNDDA